MSVKAMAWVWDQDIPREQKFVLLAYADHADHDGGNIYPAVDTIAKKTGYSDRSVQRVTRELVAVGLLIPEGVSKLQTNCFRIPINGDDKISPPIYRGAKGDKMSPQGDKITPGGDTGVTRGVTKSTQRGDIAMSPEPSLTTIKPPVNPTAAGGVFREYEANIGILTPMVRDEIIDLLDEFPEEWIVEAMQIAVANNARRLSYFRSILDRWKRDGKDDGKKPVATEPERRYSEVYE